MRDAWGTKEPFFSDMGRGKEAKRGENALTLNNGEHL